MHLKGRIKDREGWRGTGNKREKGEREAGEREGKREGENACGRDLVHFKRAAMDRAGSSSSREAELQSRVPHGCKGPITWAFFFFLPAAVSRSFSGGWIENSTVRT